MALGVDTIPYRLAQERVGMLLAGHVEQGPGTPGENDTMAAHFVLDGELEMIECFARRLLRQSREDALGALLVGCARSLTQTFAAEPIGGRCRNHHLMQQLLSPAAFFLD